MKGENSLNPYIPIDYRETELTTKCKCCGSEIKMKPTISPVDYEKMPSYLDGFKKGMEKDFFEMKFIVCNKCKNFNTRSLNNDFYQFIIGNEIENIVNFERDKIEKAFIVQYLIFKDTISLLELYWYLDFNKPNSEELIHYRDILIKQYESELTTPASSIKQIITLADLYRRKGDFKTAIKFCKKMKKKTSVSLKETFDVQIKLAKQKDSNRY